MGRLIFGEWVIEADVKATKEYNFKWFPSRRDNQCYRNFCKFCENDFSKEEMTFFDSLGIMVKNCDVTSAGMIRGGVYPTSGFYYIAGRYLQKPKMSLPTIEEQTRGNSVDNRPDCSFCIGRFTFTFMDSNSVFSIIPDDLPEGFICLGFMVYKMPWLLKETCDKRVHDSAKWWDVFGRVKERKQAKRTLDNREGELRNKIIKDLQDLDLPFHVMNQRQLNVYRKRWMAAFAPDVNKKQMKKIFMNDDKSGGFLWDIFRSGLVRCEEQEEAVKSYTRTKRWNCTIVIQTVKLGIVVEQAVPLTWQRIHKYDDIYVTDADFIWTYVHTHEGYGGPYFYDRLNPPSGQSRDMLRHVQKTAG